MHGNSSKRSRSDLVLTPAPAPAREPGAHLGRQPLNANEKYFKEGAVCRRRRPRLFGYASNVSLFAISSSGGRDAFLAYNDLPVSGWLSVPGPRSAHIMSSTRPCRSSFWRDRILLPFWRSCGPRGQSPDLALCRLPIAAAGQLSSRRGTMCTRFDAVSLFLCRQYSPLYRYHLYSVCGFGHGPLSKSRVIVAAVSFALAIACRQYAVAFPIGISCTIALMRRIYAKKCGKEYYRCRLASATLEAGALFFGAMAPRVAISDQHIAVGHLFPAHGLYFFSCIGIYFVVVETVLFRSVDELRRVTLAKLLLAGITSVCFLFFPPTGNTRSIHSVNGVHG